MRERALGSPWYEVGEALLEEHADEELHRAPEMMGVVSGMPFHSWWKYGQSASSCCSMCAKP
jgi:hypothetical protein